MTASARAYSNALVAQHIRGFDVGHLNSVHLPTFVAVVRQLIGAGLRVITESHLLRDCRIRGSSYPAPRFEVLGSIEAIYNRIFMIKIWFSLKHS